MNAIKTWYYFHAPERRFHSLSFELLTISSRMNALNDKRKKIQRKIIELGEGSRACQLCQGKCCGGNYDHFTAVDYIMRIFSDNPIKSYGDLWKPKSFISIVLNRMGYWKKTINSSKQPLTRCPNLEETGCNLSAEERPIRCILWTCHDFRDSLQHEKLIEIGSCERELEKISRDAIKIIFKTARGKRFSFNILNRRMPISK